MDFKFYNLGLLLPIFKDRYSSGLYEVCQGCVFTEIPPEDCIHPRDDFQTPSVQSDKFCFHCFDTIEEDKEPFHLHEDPNLSKKIAELERILEMISLE